jgi:hypothetical protein
MKDEDDDPPPLAQRSLRNKIGSWTDELLGRSRRPLR